jgi:hypothetical protein
MIGMEDFECETSLFFLGRSMLDDDGRAVGLLVIVGIDVRVVALELSGVGLREDLGVLDEVGVRLSGLEIDGVFRLDVFGVFKGVGLREGVSVRVGAGEVGNVQVDDPSWPGM